MVTGLAAACAGCVPGSDRARARRVRAADRQSGDSLSLIVGQAFVGDGDGVRRLTVQMSQPQARHRGVPPGIGSTFQGLGNRREGMAQVVELLAAHPTDHTGENGSPALQPYIPPRLFSSFRWNIFD
jgi:hypothetical protein